MHSNRFKSHWQLRSLVSSPGQNIVYYPSGTDIYSLNTKTRESEIITTLSYSPRCLVASKQWLCCGGDKGNYTAIPLCENTIALESYLDQDAGPDDRLPLDFDSSRRLSTRDRTSSLPRFRPPTRHIAANTLKIGAEIVNCITLWSPTEGLSSRTYNIPVAVVSNNDRTVSILDVQSSEILEKITLPDCVNRSVMSPNGELLITVCDDPFLYVHERKKKIEPKRDKYSFKSGHHYEWVQSGRIQLEGQRQADKSDLRGSFAACFSNSGKYLAVATQYGIISIFDAEHLTDSGSLIVVFTSSRPGPEHGAVRAMEFSPGPFDLLVSRLF